jgi:hypothetical protein
MTITPHRRRRGLSLLLLLLLLPAAVPPTVLAQTATPASDLPSILAQPPRAQKSIPLRWKIAILGGSCVLAGAAFALALRTWRSSNLFDREYRFPVPEKVALRLGANRCGGAMATIDFRAPAAFDSSPEDSQERDFER